jgi:hypothetical protein
MFVMPLPHFLYLEVQRLFMKQAQAATVLIILLNL